MNRSIRQQNQTQYRRGQPARYGTRCHHFKLYCLMRDYMFQANSFFDASSKFSTKSTMQTNYDLTSAIHCLFKFLDIILHNDFSYFSGQLNQIWNQCYCRSIVVVILVAVQVAYINKEPENQQSSKSVQTNFINTLLRIWLTTKYLHLAKKQFKLKPLMSVLSYL